MKFRSKIILVTIIFMCLVTLIGANLNTYFGRIDTEITVTQSVTIDGLPVTKPVTHTLKIMSGDSETVTHTISNVAKTCNVSINQMTMGLVLGLNLTIKYMNGTVVQFPFNLSCNSGVELQFIYDTDVNLKSKTYKVKTYFDVEEV